LGCPFNGSFSTRIVDPFLETATCKIGDSSAVEPLIKALKDKYYGVRREAANALVNIGDARAVEPLIKALKDKDKDVRERAARALVKIGGVKAVEPFIKALKDKDIYARYEAMGAICKIGKPAVEPLLEALVDEDCNVRQGAAKVLGNIGDIRAVEPLIKVLKNKDPYVTSSAVYALGVLGDARAIAPILDVLFSEPGDFGKDSDIVCALLKLASTSDSAISRKTMRDAIDAAGHDSPNYSNGVERYRKRKSNAAIRRLCSDKSSVVNNLLILISRKEDVVYEESVPEPYNYIEYRVNFEEQRQMAIDELERRGSPSYDPSAFLKSPE